MKLTVVIPSAGRMELLDGCLASLMALERPVDQVLVVFQGHRDPAVANRLCHRYPLVEPLWIHKRGASAARNAGVSASESELILFVDDDCIVDPGWSRVYAQAFSRDPSLMLASGQVRASTTGLDAQVGLALQLDERERSFDRLSNPFGTVDRGGNMAVRRVAFDRLGGFDEGLGAGSRFCSAEDTDLVYRAMRLGMLLRYLPNAVVVHEQWRTVDEAALVERGYARGLGAFLVGHARRGDLYALGLFARFSYWLGWRPLITGLVRRRPARIRNGQTYLGGLTAGMIAGFRRVPEVPAPRSVNDSPPAQGAP